MVNIKVNVFARQVYVEALFSELELFHALGRTVNKSWASVTPLSRLDCRLASVDTRSCRPSRRSSTFTMFYDSSLTLLLI